MQGSGTLGSLAYCVDVPLSPNITMTESDSAKTIPSSGMTKPVQKPEDIANAVVRVNVGGVSYTATAVRSLYCKNSALQQLSQSYLVLYSPTQHPNCLIVTQTHSHMFYATCPPLDLEEPSTEQY